MGSGQHRRSADGIGAPRAHLNGADGMASDGINGLQSEQKRTETRGST